jgi:hypothetical protein
MDAIVTAALMGTARQHGEATPTGTPVDELLANVEGATPERRLLLLAGALAAYRRAGQVASMLPEVSEPAPAETTSLCSPAAADLVGNLLDLQSQSGEAELLRVALDRLHRAGRHLPPEVLPALLTGARREVRPALAAVVGERGRWLGQLNPDWSWLDETAVETSGAIPEDADTVWQEASPARRLRLLRQVRASDPARARTWVQAAWRQEKADFRADMVRALEENLSADDESLLESALDDRSEQVRGAVAPLLARISTSAFNVRMATRADTLLTYARDKLTVTLPQTLDKSWQRDGITQKPPGMMGERSWWLRQVLSLVPPRHWEERFGLTPKALMAAALAGGEHGPEVLDDWSEAAQLHHDTNWALALWHWAHEPRPAKSKAYALDNVAAALRNKLLTHLPAAIAQEYALSLLTADDPSQDVEWETLTQALPQQWTLDFAQTYLRGLRAFVAKQLSAKTYDTQPWYESLPLSALALPPQCFAAALQLWKIPEDNDWRIQDWRNRLNRFTHLIGLRQRLIAEIPLADE